jgi:hypothetical protein
MDHNFECHLNQLSIAEKLTEHLAVLVNAHLTALHHSFLASFCLGDDLLLPAVPGHKLHISNTIQQKPTNTLDRKKKVTVELTLV